MEKSIVPIVEGYSEVYSVPVLLRRLLNEWGVYQIKIEKPFRVQRTKVVQEGELERAIQIAQGHRPRCAAFLILLDAHDDCPARLAPLLKERAACVTHLPVAVVLAKCEFESWFLGSKESLRGFRGISKDACSPPNPEEIKGAKELIAQNMTSDRNYVEVDDQPAFADKFDLHVSRSRCPSLDKLFKDFYSLIKSQLLSPS